jgi:bacterial regulatory protein, arsR family
MLEPLFTDIFRFRIAVALFRNELNYTTLKNELSATDGNISFHLKKLEKA